MSQKSEYNSFFLGKAFKRLQQNSLAYHRVGCWLAIAINPIFALSDYFNFPNYWLQSLLIRLCVSLLVFVALIFQKLLRINSSVLVAIPLILISFQNAHMYEFAQEKDLLGQHLNYMALFIGASLFILWRWYYSAVAVVVSAIAT
ncbi:MAG: hypothetical protein H7282_13355, partial [Cytophagaceae bacterium]|nr:hypothetical protein [Cytophagaceae bacterium]